MAINEKILQKVNEKTQNNPQMRDFLLRLINFEVEGHGWFMKTYKQELEDIVKEAKEP